MIGPDNTGPLLTQMEMDSTRGTGVDPTRPPNWLAPGAFLKGYKW